MLAEIEGQAQSLKKQARQAERYRGLAQTLRETEALLLHRRWTEAREREAEAQTHLREAERAVAPPPAEASAAERDADEAREALGAAARSKRWSPPPCCAASKACASAWSAISPKPKRVIARCDADAARAATKPSASKR